MISKIKASVCIVTYNQAKYLRECLASLISQEVDFEYEIIVGDDASTDDTLQVVEELSSVAPGLIRYIRHTHNIGPTANYIAVHKKALGEFVFHMDGDDVAFPGKLKKQVKYLESRPDCVICWHQVNVFDDQGRVEKVLHSQLPEIVDVDRITRRDLLRYGMLGAHSSTLYRRSAMPEDISNKDELLDYYVIGLIMRSGSACRIEEVLGGYRVNAGSTTASKKRTIYFRGALIRHLYCKHLEDFLSSSDGAVFRTDIFLNALFNFVIDVRFLRPSAKRFLCLALRTYSLSGIKQFPDYCVKSLRLRR